MSDEKQRPSPATIPAGIPLTSHLERKTPLMKPLHHGPAVKVDHGKKVSKDRRNNPKFY
jgi:hypothetical protein